MSEPVVQGYIPVTFTQREIDFVEFVCFKIEDFFDRVSLQNFKRRYPKKGGFKGAYCAHPDYEKIKKRIAFMQQDFPEYSGGSNF